MCFIFPGGLHKIMHLDDIPRWYQPYTSYYLAVLAQYLSLSLFIIVMAHVIQLSVGVHTSNEKIHKNNNVLTHFNSETELITIS